MLLVGTIPFEARIAGDRVPGETPAVSARLGRCSERSQNHLPARWEPRQIAASHPRTQVSTFCTASDPAAQSDRCRRDADPHARADPHLREQLPRDPIREP